MSRLIINLHSHEETFREGIHSAILSSRYHTINAEDHTDLEPTQEARQAQQEVDSVDSDLDVTVVELDTLWSDDISANSV
ncbi:hypothetical protein VKT23_018985 [Stygiomarasmius scandens]|uniref:Uncharacterized protein n=1 Tax=Marasmiellus scandens TaxID=2682957 RepID=A0ABR1IMM3_9AGAR